MLCWFLPQVRYAAAGYKERYYKCKFSAEGPGDIESKRKEVVRVAFITVILYFFIPHDVFHFLFLTEAALFSL